MNKHAKIFVTIIAFLTMGISATTQASLHTEKVQYKDGHVVLVGYLAYDDSMKGQRPGVLVVHEWWGLNDYAKMRAEALAKQGYIALAVDMYGEGKITDHPKQAGEWSALMRQNRQLARERFVTVFDLLKNHKMTEKSKNEHCGALCQRESW